VGKISPLVEHARNGQVQQPREDADMTLRERVTQVLREPLVHFLAAGLLIFIITGRGDDGIDKTITVTEDQVTQLARGWEQSWKRPPTAREIDGLIQDHVKDEVYYREALRLGLDDNDPIVRRRMRSKLEFLSDADADAPSEAELEAWLSKTSARYVTDPVFDVDQIFLGQNAAQMDALLAQLRGGADPATLGETISLPRTLTATPKTEIARQFGDDFAASLSTHPLGTWSGPAESGFGVHLVRVRKMTAAKRPALADVRQSVENDWRNANRQQREADAFRAMVDRYDVKIERPE
jgi:peptidyl-prolyl cis-trans isomerase C